MDAESIFRIQKCVQVAPRKLSFRVKLEEAKFTFGPNLRGKKWHVVIITIEDAAHRSAAHFDSSSNVGGIYVFYPGGKISDMIRSGEHAPGAMGHGESCAGREKRPSRNFRSGTAEVSFHTTS